MAETAIRWRELFVGERGRLTAGVLLVEFLVAVEALVVVAIMPAVRHDLGGIQYYGLVFTGYSLAALVATPVAGRVGDRPGPTTPFLSFASIFIAGTALCAMAPTMPFLILARIVQGFGAGGAYTLALAAVTSSYDDAGRARLLALLAGAWIIPGLLGPSFGALLASTVGWRWAFVSIMPLIALAIALALPGIRGVTAGRGEAEPLALRWPLQLAAGLTALVIGVTFFSWPSLLLVLLGVPLTVTALLALLPAGSLQAKAGMPAGIVISFLLIFAFIGTEYFLPLILTEIRGRSLAEAGLIVTLGTVSWSVGNWWQARVIHRISVVTLVRGGVAMLSLAIAGVLLLLVNAPLPLSYAAWFLAGIGMGIAYPTAYLAIMRAAPPGHEGVAVGSQQVAERLALAVGGAVGGGCIAVSLALHAGLRLGLAVTIGLAAGASLAALAVAPRLASEP